MKKYRYILFIAIFLLLILFSGYKYYVLNKTISNDYVGENNRWKVVVHVYQESLDLTCFNKDPIPDNSKIQIEFSQPNKFKTSGTLGYGPSKKSFYCKITYSKCKLRDYTNEIVKIKYNNSVDEIVLAPVNK